MAFKSQATKSQGPTINDAGLLILRWVAAGMLIFHHGAVKITHMIHGNFAFGDPIGIGVTASLVLAAFAEGICSFLAAIGLYTRIASAILVINFIVAFFASWDERALLYLGIYLAVLLIGAGKYSLDWMRKK